MHQGKIMKLVFRLVIAVTASLSLGGCASYLADKHFRSQAEVTAMNSASWVFLFTNADGKDISYDPYRLIWVSDNTFKAPITFPMSSGVYGAWVYEMSCTNNTVTVLRTLGSTLETRNLVQQAAPDSIVATARDRICGIKVGAKSYSYISADANRNAYYYDQNNLGRSAKNQNIYRFDWILFDPKTKKNLKEQTSEVNCLDKTIKLTETSQWQSTKFLTAENIFIARFCPSVTSRRPFLYTYSSANNELSTDAYLKKLNSEETKPTSSRPKTEDKGSNSNKTGFEWEKLVIHPKD